MNWFRNNNGPQSAYRTKKATDKKWQNTYNYRNWEKYYEGNGYPIYDPKYHYIASSSPEVEPILWCDDKTFKN